MSAPQSKRNAIVFDRWWLGAAKTDLAREYDVTVTAISIMIVREIRQRKLPRVSIIKRLRKQIGMSCARAPRSKEELVQLVLEVYELV